MYNLLSEKKCSSQPIRILIINGKMICGGVESFIMNIYRNMDRTKVQFDFLVHYKDKYFYDDEIISLGGKIFYLTFRDDKNFFKYKRDLNCFFENHPEYQILWGQMDGLASIYLKIAKKNNVKFAIMHSHITNSEHSLKGIVKKILRNNISKYSDLRLACSTEAGKYLYKKNNFQLCHNAIDISKFVFDINIRKKIRNEFRFRDDTFIIGNVGRFVPQKNHLFLIDVFTRLPQDGTYKLLLCGDGELRKQVTNYAINKKVIQNVVFAGNVQNMNEVYQAMDIFVMPSLYEGLPVSGIEAQANGLPCIFANTITREVAIDKCRFLGIDNVDEWVKLIMEKPKRSDDSEKLLVENGYSISDLVNRLVSLFVKIHNSKSKNIEVKLYE